MQIETLHAANTDERIQYEKLKPGEATLRDYGAVALARPHIPLLVLAFLAAAVIAAMQAVPDLLSVGGVGWLVLSAFFVFLAMIALDDFACLADESHTCWECRQVDKRYGGDH